LPSPISKTIVVMPTAHRPEFLALALERLAAARKPSNIDVHIYVDFVDHIRLAETEIVRDLYFPEAYLFLAGPHVQVPSGCWNILNSIKNGSLWADDVILVEDDVMVYPDFFEWHQTAVWADASCGRSLSYFNLYTNPGSCLRRPLLDLLVPHINDEYFRDTKAYCDKNFQPNHISTLDDGLIRRVLHDNNMTVLFPERPRCAHQGFRGYRSYDIFQNEGEVEERIAGLRQIIAKIEAGDPHLTRYATRLFEPFQAPSESSSA
jgi:hypothetical protein